MGREFSLCREGGVGEGGKMGFSNLCRGSRGSSQTVSSNSLVAYHQGRNLEADTNTETVKENCYRLVPHGLLGLLSYTIQDDLPRHGHGHRALALQRGRVLSAPQSCLQANPMQAFSKLVFCRFTSSKAIAVNPLSLCWPSLLVTFHSSALGHSAPRSRAGGGGA